MPSCPWAWATRATAGRRTGAGRKSCTSSEREFDGHAPDAQAATGCRCAKPPSARVAGRLTFAQHVAAQPGHMGHKLAFLGLDAHQPAQLELAERLIDPLPRQAANQGQLVLG